MTHSGKDAFFRTAIRNCFPSATNIRHPDSCPTFKPIFLADTRKRGPIICKFVDARIAARDRIISQKLVSKGMPIPTIKTHAYIAQWFEDYDYNPNHTFAEHIKNHMSDTKILETYKQMLDFQAKLADCSLDDIYVSAGKYFSDVYEITAPSTRSRVLTQIYAVMIKILSRYHNVHVVHCDLKPNNVICNPDGSLNQVIDITGIALASEEFAMISLLDAFPLPDMREELMDYYDKITHRNLNRDFIRTGLDLIQKKYKIQSKIREFKKIFNFSKAK